MKNYQSLGLALLAVVSSSCLKQASKTTDVDSQASTNKVKPATITAYSNPCISTQSSDPQLMKGFDGAFYCYYPDTDPTTGNKCYSVFKSTDLVNWTQKSSNVFSKSGYGLWSAGTYKMNNTYYLYYTQTGSAHKTIGVATSTSPLGPFVDQGVIINSSSTSPDVIDPFVFKDPANGNLYLYYSEEATYLKCQKLNADGITKASQAPTVVLDLNVNHQNWEMINVEHPMVFYAPNAAASHRYYLLYNGAGGALPRYAIGYAYSSTATGTFTRAPEGSAAGDNPIVHQDTLSNGQAIYGPGAPNTIVDDAGTRWLLYRIKTTKTEDWGDRVTCIDELYRNSSDKLTITPTYKKTISAGPDF